MTDPVFLVADLPSPGPYVLDGDEGRHAAAVKRLRPGEKLVLSDGAGAWAMAEVTAAAPRTLTVEVGDARFDPPPPLQVTLVQALPKGDRSELAVELATEAGIDAIIPWQAARCVARWDGSADKATRGREKWQRAAREAAKQARRHYVPPVSAIMTTPEVIAAARNADGALLLHEEASIPIDEVDLPQAGNLLLIVGPEGGVAAEELTALTQAGAIPTRLGAEVLRTSTAAAVALGALGILTGRWGRGPS